MQREKKTIITPAAISSVIIAATGLAWSQYLLTTARISQITFLGLVTLCVLVGLFIAFNYRIKLLNLRQLTLELERVEEARKDVEARESRVRQIAKIVSEITLFSAAFQHRNLGEGESETQRAWLESKVRELLATISASPEEQTKTFRFHEAAKQLDELRNTIDDREWGYRWDEIYRKVADEAQKTA